MLFHNRCRILPAGGLGVSPIFNKKSPEYGGFRGLIRLNPRFSNSISKAANSYSPLTGNRL